MIIVVPSNFLSPVRLNSHILYAFVDSSSLVFFLLLLLGFQHLPSFLQVAGVPVLVE